MTIKIERGVELPAETPVKEVLLPMLKGDLAEYPKGKQKYLSSYISGTIKLLTNKRYNVMNHPTDADKCLVYCYFDGLEEPVA